MDLKSSSSLTKRGVINVKRLRVSQRDRILMGVCGGIADYFNIDSMIVRALFILMAFAGGLGPVAYIIIGLVMQNNRT